MEFLNPETCSRVVGLAGKPSHPTSSCYLVFEIAYRTNSFSVVQKFHVGLAVDRPFYQTASFLQCNQALVIFLSLQCFFAFNSLVNCKCHLLREPSDFVSFPAVNAGPSRREGRGGKRSRARAQKGPVNILRHRNYHCYVSLQCILMTIYLH